MIWLCRAYSNCFMCGTVAHMRLPFSKYFRILYIFAQILKYFALFPFFWKIACMSFLSRIGPAMSEKGVTKGVGRMFLYVVSIEITSYNRCRWSLFYALKGTLMRIWRSPYVCVGIKIIPENFAFLVPRILELFTHEVRIFLKK